MSHFMLRLMTSVQVKRTASRTSTAPPIHQEGCGSGIGFGIGAERSMGGDGWPASDLIYSRSGKRTAPAGRAGAAASSEGESGRLLLGIRILFRDQDRLGQHALLVDAPFRHQGLVG